MAEANRRAFLKGASAVALGGTAGLVGAQGADAADTDHEAFLALSAAVTGLTAAELPAVIDQTDSQGVQLKLYELYFERLRSSYPAEFRELLAAWRQIEDQSDPEAALSAKLTEVGPAAERLRVAARQVAKIWLLSTIDDPRTRPDPKNGKNSGQLGGDLGQYQNSMIWKLIGAPVPGYSNCTHGYWVNKPNLNLDPCSKPPLITVPIDPLPAEMKTYMELPDG